jgi:hypothetical protein
MPTLTLRPNSDELTTSWSKPGGDYFYENVDEAISNDDTDYIVTSELAGVNCRFGLPNIGDVGQIDSVKVYIVCRSESDSFEGTCKTLLRTGGVDYYGDSNTPSTTYTSYNTTFTEVQTWQQADSLQIGVCGNAGYDVEHELIFPLRCTQIYVEIVYTVVIPVDTTNNPTGIDNDSATGNGEIISTGGATVTRRGFCHKETADDWILPTSHSDPDSKWVAESDAYDNDLESAASTSWTGYYLYLYPATSLYGDAVRLYARVIDAGSNPQNPNVAIDIYSGGSYTNIFSGVITKDTWITKSFTACQVDGIRIKWNGGDTGTDFYLWEFNFYGTAIPTTSDSVIYEDDSYSAGVYSLGIIGLVAETTYLIRAYADNSEGTGYGYAKLFTTLASPLLRRRGSFFKML